MKNNKVIKIMIPVLVILAVACGALAYVIFATDLLKTDAQLFEKYGEEIVSELKEFFNNESMDTYYEKKTLNNYENKGSIVIQAKINDDDENIDINDTTLSFYGATDVANKKAEQNINLNYSDKETFAFKYVRNNDLYALTSAEVVNKYIAIDNNNLKDLATKLGREDTEKIPDKITLEDYKSKINEEELKNLQTKYMNIITDQLTKEDFSKEEGKENSYTLTIRDEKLKNIITNIMQELKNESLILDTFEDESMITNYQKNIDKNIEKLKEEDFSNRSLQITVEKMVDGIAKIHISMMTEDETINIDLTKSDNENISINIKVESDNSNMVIYNENQGDTTNTNEVNIAINKTSTEDECSYIITVNGADNKLTISATLNGLSTNKVKETYSVQLEQSEELNMGISFTNLITFNDTVNITELDNDNSVTLNNYNENELISLTGQLVEQIEKVHEEKLIRAMQQISNGDKNVGIITYINYSIILGQQDIINKAKEAQDENKKQIEEMERKLQEQYNQMINDI